MKYTEKKANDDFDYLSRKLEIFRNMLIVYSDYEFAENFEFVDRFFDELNDCFNELKVKYLPYFPKLEETDSYIYCEHIYQSVCRLMERPIFVD